MAIFYTLIAALCLSGGALAQIPALGACPCVEAQTEFDIARILGDWYVYKSSPTMFELSGRCTKWNVECHQEGSAKLVVSYLSGLTGQEESYDTSVNVDRENPSSLSIKFPLTPNGDMSNCWSLGSDHENYIVGWCCTEYGGINVQYAWALTRARNPEECVIENIDGIIAKNNIPTTYLWKADQKNCE